MKNKEFFDLRELNIKEVFGKSVHYLQITQNRKVIAKIDLNRNDDVFQKTAKWLESKCAFVQRQNSNVEETI